MASHESCIPYLNLTEFTPALYACVDVYFHIIARPEMSFVPSENQTFKVYQCIKLNEKAKSTATTFTFTTEHITPK